jgi:uncharacterized protein
VSATGGERVTRRRFLAAGAFAAVAGVAGYGRFVEPSALEVTRHPVGGGEPAADPLRIVQLTDLHLRRIGRFEEAVAAAVRAAAPGLIVLTGDSVDRPDAMESLDAFLPLLPRGVPGFATLGNWEHWSGIDRTRLDALYARHGIRLLVNASAGVPHAGGRLLVTGLDDATAGRPDPTAALDGVEPSADHLVLAHSPAYRDRLGAELPPGFRPTLVLGGHTHGGQVALAGWAPLRPPGSGRYVSGWYRDEEPQLYVSRGIGTSVVPVRFGARPELAVLEWRLRGGRG